MIAGIGATLPARLGLQTICKFYPAFIVMWAFAAMCVSLDISWTWTFAWGLLASIPMASVVAMNGLFYKQCSDEMRGTYTGVQRGVEAFGNVFGSLLGGLCMTVFLAMPSLQTQLPG